VLRRIFGPKRDEVTGEWRKLHNEKIKDMYSTNFFSGDQIEKNETGGACSTYGGQVRCYMVSMEKAEGKRPLGRPRRR
jgi:hypothetical protein